MATKDIFTGGACNVNEQGGQQNQNPFNKFMDTMFTGNGQNKQMVQGFTQEQNPEMIQQQLALQKQQMQQMNQEWSQLNKDFQQKAQVDKQMHGMMNQQFEQEKLAHQQRIQFEQQQMQNAWKQEQIMFQANKWAQDQAFQQAHLNAESQVKLESEFREQQNEQENTNDEEQERIHNAANQLFEQMAKDDDPRFKNSKFLNFLGQIKSGELQIKGKELISTSELSQDKQLEGAWEESKEQYNSNIEQMKQAYQTATQEQAQEKDKFEDFWAKRIAEYETQQNSEDFGKTLEEQYQQVLKNMQENQDSWNDQDMLGEAWEKNQDVEEYALYKDATDKYQFRESNPYLNHENPLAAGLEFMAMGKASEAILAFEASLQKDPENKQNGNTWRIMGRLLQDNDQDQKAVTCFLNCLKFDENNSDCLLALGISCTNILDEVKAMNYLKRWLQINPAYQSLNIDSNLIPNENIHEFTTEQIKQINRNMIQTFQKAKEMNPSDSELLQSLAVLHFIAREYEQSVVLFQQALQFDQDNYSLWNKFGATLAHLGRAEQAMEAYHKALDIKPNYVRVWVNLGIAYAYKSDYEEAARLYLNALSLNPDAIHIWTYLQTTLMCLQRFDLVGKIPQKDVNLFRQDFDILRLEDLPEPEIPYGLTSTNVVLKRDGKVKN